MKSFDRFLLAHRKTFSVPSSVQDLPWQLDFQRWRTLLFESVNHCSIAPSDGIVFYPTPDEYR